MGPFGTSVLGFPTLFAHAALLLGRAEIATAAGRETGTAGPSTWSGATESAAASTTGGAGPRAAESAAAPWAARAEPASGPLLTRARFAHREAASHEGLLIEALDRRFGDGSLQELDEGEPTGTTRVAIDRDHHVRRFPDRREVRPKIRFGRPIRHVAYEQTYSHDLSSPRIYDECRPVRC